MNCPNCKHSIDSHVASFGECLFLGCGCELKPSEIVEIETRAMRDTLANARPFVKDMVGIASSARIVIADIDTLLKQDDK